MNDSYVSQDNARLLEPAALGGFTSSSNNAKRAVDPLVSIAISMKRIADQLSPSHASKRADIAEPYTVADLIDILVERHI
jgi:hypothetical protein